MVKSNILAIVVTYNRKDLLEECINALVNSKYKTDILVIDNASSDGTSDFIEEIMKENKNIFYRTTGSNLGGAGGFNFGVKEAFKMNYEYLWIMDDDTIVHEDALSELISKAKKINNKFSFLSSIALWKDRELCKMNIQEISDSAIKSYYTIADGLVNIESASFVSCLINTEIAKKVGLPIKEFFIYGDDLEYTKRLSTIEKGYLVPTSIVNHKMKTNDGIDIIGAEESRIDRYFYSYRNLLYVFKKYNKKEFRIFKIKCYYLILKVLVKSKKYKFRRIKVLIRALIEYRLFNPTIETY